MIECPQLSSRPGGAGPADGVVMQSEPQTVHFGTYTVNLQSGELHRNGVKIKVPEQSFQILTCLLEHPGEVVNRKQLEAELWPDGTVVDYEHSLNAAVKRLREALGDTAEHPQFVETLPRRGYRFIYPVEGHAAKRRRWVWALNLATLPAVLVLLLALNVGHLRDRLLGRPLPGEITSIAVLPLDNLSGDPEQEYFADGMTEALLTELGKISALRVISRQSVMQFKNSEKTLPEIARELNVDAAIEGSAVREGDRVRITIQLIRAKPEQHLWAENYERDFTNTLGLQGEMARAIARQVRVTLTPEDEARLATARPVSPEAHTAYLKGRYFWNKRTPAGMEKAVEYFQQAIEKDPGFARAYVGLADTYMLMGKGELEYTAAKKALELDDQLAEAHLALAGLPGLHCSIEDGYKRAIALSPSYATAHHWYATYLWIYGRDEESLAEMELAQQLDPTSMVINSALADKYRTMGQHEKALQQIRKTLEMDPNFPLAHMVLSRIHQEKGQYAEAIEELETARDLGGYPEEILGFLGYTYAKQGNRPAAEKVINELVEQLHSGIKGCTYELALVYAGLEDADRTFYWLEKARENKVGILWYVPSEEAFEFVHSDPRWQRFLDRFRVFSKEKERRRKCEEEEKESGSD